MIDAQDGIEKIKRWLKEKKVLIVLDGVNDKLEQLEKLAGGGDWFGRGSRVIITTRDKGLLRWHGVDEKYIYEVQTLEEQEATQLFKSYAFKKKPKTGVEQLCGSVVHYCEGLPLALKVLGSSLCGLEIAHWESTLKDLKDTPHNDIYGKLKISYDKLDSKNKKIFLHIACFFRHAREEYVKDVLKSCDLQPDSAMRNLTEKSLISVIDDGRVEMYDLIQEMGWHIAASEEPRSRVWQLKDVYDLLWGKMDPKLIEGIVWFDEVSGSRYRSVEISMREMRNLKMLKVGHGFHLEENYLPSSLRWLQFDFYHFTSLPESFASSKLVCLSLRSSSLQNCRIAQKLDKLTLLDLSCSSSLLETPDFDTMPNLRRLNLSDCNNLKEVHPSIGNLSKLVLLDLSCSNIESLSSFNQVSSLNSLDLCGCRKLKFFPEIKARTPHLLELDLIYVGIIELPSSIKQLHGLTKLGLYDCEHLEGLCDGLCELKNLKVLKIQNCENLKSLPENVECLNSLEYLSLEGSNIDSLPKSFNQLPRLQYLDIRNCENLKKLPKLPETTSELYAHHCFAYREDIEELADFPKLQSVAFSSSYEGGIHFAEIKNFAEMCIHFPYRRMTPFSVTYPLYSSEVGYEDPWDGYEDPCDGYEDPWDEIINVLKIFQYRCYESNGIAIDLNSDWYCQSFAGFAVYFLTGLNTWGLHPYSDIADVEHCTIIVKLSCKDNRNEVLQRKCVIVLSRDDSESKGSLCFVYIPFSDLWPAKSNSLTSNDISRFEVNFMDSEAIAIWGCSLLYERWEGPARWDDSCEGSTTDIGPFSKLEYLNLFGKRFKHLPEDISRLCHLQYLDISGCRRLGRELPELPPTIRELYANSNLASENNIAELATKYSELYSVSFSIPIYTDDHPVGPPLLPRKLVKKFIPITQPFLNRNTPFAITYLRFPYRDYNISRFFKYPHHDPHHDRHKISISLDPTWYNHNFVGFVVCFLFPKKVRWKSQPNIRPFRHCELIAKLTHKDNNGSEPPLQTKCVIGRLYEEKFHDPMNELVCFAYIPFSSLWPKSKAIMDNLTPNHYLVFEAAIQDLKIEFNRSLRDCNWSCGLLYTDYESLTEALWKKRESDFSENDSGIDSKIYEDEDGDGDEEEEEDGESEHIEDSGGDDAMAEDINSDHIDDEEASMAKDSSVIIHATLSEDQPASTRPNPITGEEIQSDNNYHNDNEEDYETTASQQELEATVAEHSAKSPIETSVCKTVFEAPKVQTSEKRKAHTLSSVNEEEDEEDKQRKKVRLNNKDKVAVMFLSSLEEEEEDKQRKKARLDNNDKEDIIINSGKKNKGKNEQNDGRGELLATNVQPLFVDDDVFQRLGNDCKQLYNLLRLTPNIPDYLDLELDANIFHHMNMERIFVMIEDIKDLFTMNWLDVSIIQVFIRYLYQLCKKSKVSSIGFMCPTQISKANVDMNLEAVIAYLRNTISELQDKTFILAPYHQVNHWSLLAICTSSRMVYVLDPMQCDRDLEIKPVLNMVFRTFTNQRGARARCRVDWKNIKCPCQPGNSECGYYVMRYMYDICTKYFASTLLDEAFQETKTYSDMEIDEIRNKWAQYFLNECV